MIESVKNWLYNNPEKRGPDQWFRQAKDMLGPDATQDAAANRDFDSPMEYPPLCLDVMRIFWYTMAKGSVLNTALQPQVCAGNGLRKWFKPLGFSLTGLNHYHNLSIV